MADKPYGGPALIVLAFAESSFFPVPPDVLLMPLCLGARKKAFLFALYCSIGSVLGGLFGYWIGQVLWWSGAEFSGLALFFFEYIPGFTQEKFIQVKALYDSYDFWIVFTAGFTPLPYKVITISAGAFDLNFGMFLFASCLSRSARFFMVAGLLSYFGDPVKEFIDKYFNLLAILFVVLLFGGFLALKYL
ncbi:YqaA family protein [Fibrobacterota bacterium]